MNAIQTHWLSLGNVARAAYIAIGSEFVLAACFAFSGFGPCGPSNPLGFVGLLGHLPGLLAVGLITLLVPLPAPAETVVAIVMQILLVFALARGALRPKPWAG